MATKTAERQLVTNDRWMLQQCEIFEIDPTIGGDPTDSAIRQAEVLLREKVVAKQIGLSSKEYKALSKTGKLPCYGDGSAHDPENKECQQCPAFQNCRVSVALYDDAALRQDLIKEDEMTYSPEELAELKKEGYKDHYATKDEPEEEEKPKRRRRAPVVEEPEQDDEGTELSSEDEDDIVDPVPAAKPAAKQPEAAEPEKPKRTRKPKEKAAAPKPEPIEEDEEHTYQVTPKGTAAAEEIKIQSVQWQATVQTPVAKLPTLYAGDLDDILGPFVEAFEAMGVDGLVLYAQRYAHNYFRG